MLIDDEPLITMGLKKVIQWERLDLVCAGAFSSSKLALEALLKNPVDVLVIDMKMPEFSGIDVIRILRQHGLHTKCIILSVHDDFSLIHQALPLGIENYLLKPVNVEELNSALEAAIAKIQSEQKQEQLLSVGMTAFCSSILTQWLYGKISQEGFFNRAALFDFFPGSGGYQALVLPPDCPEVERSALRAHLQDVLASSGGGFVSPGFQDAAGRWLMLCSFQSHAADLSSSLSAHRATLTPVAASLQQLPSLLAQTALRLSENALPAHPLVQRLETYMKAHYSEHLSLKLLASRMKVSPIYLGKLFSQEKGCTFSEYLKSLRMSEAKRLLSTSDLSIAEVAVKTGWSNENYFYTCFRNETGISPRQCQMHSKRPEG